MKRADFLLELDEIFEVPPGTTRMDQHLADISGWDSLATISFIAMVDDRFDMVVSGDSLIEAKTVADLAALVSAKLED